MAVWVYVIECKNGICVSVYFDIVRIGNKPRPGIRKEDGVVGFRIKKDCVSRWCRRV